MIFWGLVNVVEMLEAYCEISGDSGISLLLLQRKPNTIINFINETRMEKEP